jgi:hypothetical protein
MEKIESISVGGGISESAVSLCIYSPDIDLEGLTRLVNCQPSEATRKGQVIGKRRPAPIGVWTLNAPPILPFPEKLDFLLQATTSDISIWGKIAKSNDIQLRCSLSLHSWSEGFDLPATLIASIGQRNWQFSVTIYSAEGEEILDAFLDKNKKRSEP